jgi:hypothetical protein
MDGNIAEIESRRRPENKPVKIKDFCVFSSVEDCDRIGKFSFKK